MVNYINGLRSQLVPASPEAAKTLILSVNGRPMARSNVWRMVKRYGFDAGVKKNVFPHIFRHSAITHCAEKGLSVYSIQAQSRHKSLGALQKYIHLSQQTVREDYDKVFNGAKVGPSKEPEKPIRPALPEPRQSEDDEILSNVLMLLGKLSEDKRRKISSVFRSFEPRIELTGG